MAQQGGQGRGSRGRWCLAGMAGAGLAGTVALGFGFVRFVGTIDRVERDPPAFADAIVALTGGAQRIEDAVDLLARGYGQRLLITGVNERTTRDALARLAPADRSLLECCVDLDYRAQNTIGNATETGRWSRRNGFRSLIVVTSNYHMPRTLAEFGRALPDVRVVPHPVVSGAVDPGTWWGRLSTTRLLVGEYVKYVGSLARTALSGPATAGRASAGRASAGRASAGRASAGRSPAGDLHLADRLAAR